MNNRLNATRRMIRTAFQAFVSLCIIAPLIYQAALNQDPKLATGWLALALGIASGVSRVMALPGVEAFLQNHVSWLAAKPPREGDDER